MFGAQKRSELLFADPSAKTLGGRAKPALRKHLRQENRLHLLRFLHQEMRIGRPLHRRYMGRPDLDFCHQIESFYVEFFDFRAMSVNIR